jgi:hypothetical protein
MFFGVLTLITALAISAVAIYYSVAGLVAIFAAAAIPIMIMGGVLEVAKLVTAVWLHWYWNQAAWWLKGYLSVAVIVLMFITSTGIFGFLSRAHIEQTASATESVLAIDRINSEIERQEALIQRAEISISAIESRTNTVESEIQAQIDREQERIDSAYARVQPAIDEQLAVIQRAEQDLELRLQTFADQIAEIDQTLQDLQAALAANDVRRAQGIVGERQDGALGPATSAAIQAYRLDQTARRDQLIERIETIRNEPNTVVERAREEISRLRSIAEQQIADSDQLIARLRSQIGQTDQTETQAQIEQQLTRIQSANVLIEQLLDEKSTAEREYRILEAEVGPLKYIAEFVYGSTDKDLLEEAVRWVIIVIIFVFDPLAVLLLIASQFTFEYERKLRAAQKEKENDNKQTTERGPIESEPTEDRTETHQVEPIAVGTGPEERGVAVQERGIELEDAEIKRTQELLELDDNVDWKEAKHQWKDEHPDETLKEWKERYIKGEIDSLPWENYLKESSYQQNAEQTENSIWNRLSKRNE